MDYYDILLASKLSEGGGSGGGGESDFSTAEVTVIKDSSHEFILSIPNIFDNTLYSTIDSEDFESGDVLQVPLYKGSVNSIIADNELRITGVGNVITGPIGDVIGITGDCTITISPAS